MAGEPVGCRMAPSKEAFMSVTSCVRRHGGVPTLFINGIPVPGVAYMTYLPERACYGDFAAAGYRLFSFSCFFATRGINELSGIYSFAEGLFEHRDEPDFTALDEGISRILSACPEAYVFPRVNVSLPAWWEGEHPEACNDHGVVREGVEQPPRGCFASPLWQTEVKRCLTQLVHHIEAQGYADHVVGYQLSGGQTEEWFPFDMAGGVGRATREGYAAACGQTPDIAEIPYRRYLNDTVADVIAELCAHVKALTGRRLVVGSFYGYTFETPLWTSGHHSLRRLLRSPDIDFLSSPVSYAGLRRPGQDYPAMTVTDTVRLHGKLYFSECDIRTHLTRPLPAVRQNACPPGTYEGAVWQPQGDEWHARQVLRAVFVRQLTQGNALWWFDMFGEWYASAGILSDMRMFADMARDALAHPDRTSACEWAVVAEDEQFLSVDGGCRCTDRGAFGLCGAPYAAYELGDMAAVFSHCKAVVFVAPCLSEAMRAAMRACDERGIPYLVQDEEHIPDVEALRALCRRGGVHLYADGGNVVYASHRCVALHTATGGRKVIRLPGVRRIYPLLAPEEPKASTLVGDSITVEAVACGTYVYQLDATEAEADPPGATVNMYEFEL